MREDGVVPGVERLLARIKELEAENKKLSEYAAWLRNFVDDADAVYLERAWRERKAKEEPKP